MINNIHINDKLSSFRIKIQDNQNKTLEMSVENGAISKEY